MENEDRTNKMKNYAETSSSKSAKKCIAKKRFQIVTNFSARENLIP